MVLCRFGRQTVTEGYRGVCRSAFNNALIAAALQSTFGESLLKMVDLTAQNIPSPGHMFIFGAFTGGAREGLGVSVDRFDVIDVKDKYDKLYAVVRFSLTFFAGLKVAQYMCLDFKVPVDLTQSVFLMQVGDCALGKGMDIIFDPAPRAGD